MNRRSFLKIMGAGGASMATFSLAKAGLSEVMRFGAPGSTGEAEAKVLDTINDYSASTMVTRVEPDLDEKALMLGLKHHLKGSTVELVQFDKHNGQFNGKGYIPVYQMSGRRFSPFHFHFYASRAGTDFDHMMYVSKDVVRKINFYMDMVYSDADLERHLYNRGGLSVIPSF